MMYILTEEEYQALKTVKRELHAAEKKRLQRLCTHIADTMPVDWGWGKNIDGRLDDPKPWGCILTKEHEWYCDSCPVQTICPKEYKKYSK